MPAMNVRRYAPIALVFGMLSSACSNDSPSDESSNRGGAGNTPSNLPDPCSLATMAELEAIVNRDLAEAKSTVYAGDPRCSWEDAAGLGVFALSLSSDPSIFEIMQSLPASKPIGGVGQAAFLSDASTVYVKTAENVFFAQSQDPVSDGQVSSQVAAAAASLPATAIARYEASYRLAKLVVDDL